MILFIIEFQFINGVQATSVSVAKTDLQYIPQIIIILSLTNKRLNLSILILRTTKMKTITMMRILTKKSIITLHPSNSSLLEVSLAQVHRFQGMLIKY